MMRLPEPTAPTFLRLPPPIRQRIYRFVGLALWDVYPYTFDLHGPGRKTWNPFNYEEPFPDTFYGLLLSCRYVYAEAAALLYSAKTSPSLELGPIEGRGCWVSSVKPCVGCVNEVMHSFIQKWPPVLPL